VPAEETQVAFGVSGIVSGIDTESMVESLVAAASAPKGVLESNLEDLEDLQEAYAGIQNRIEAFQEALEAMDTVDELRALTGTSADESAVTVALDGDAVMGNYSVQVLALASNEMEVSEGFADQYTDGTFATGTFSITYAGVQTDITIDAEGSSLQNVVDAINEQVDGVTAYVMDTGDETNPYRLVVVGDDTGADNTLSFDTSGLDSGTGQVPVFTAVQTAQDASVVINGITVTDDDNVIDNAIQGIAFTVKETTTSAVSVGVARDDDAIVAKVQAFVDAYNALVDYIDQNQVFNPDEDISGALVGESLVGSIQRELQSTLTASYGDWGELGMLASLGVTSSQSGELEFDEETFRELLDTNFDAVIDFFTVDQEADETAGTGASFLSAMKASFVTLLDSESGWLPVRGESLQESIDTTNERISDFEDYLAEYEERLRTQFTNMELTLARLEANQQALEALMPDTSSNDDDS